MTLKFPDYLAPAHERYGYGSMEVGQTISIDLSLQDESAVKIRGHLGSHAQYYSKKFKTKVHNGVLHIMRIK